MKGSDPHVPHHEGRPEQPQQKQPHHEDQNAPQHADRVLIFLKKTSQPADRKAQGVEDDGKAEDEKQRVKHRRPPNLKGLGSIRQLADGNAGDVGNIRGIQGETARGDKGKHPGPEGEPPRHFRHQSSLPSVFLPYFSFVNCSIRSKICPLDIAPICL